MQTHLPNLSNLHVTPVGARFLKCRRTEANDEANDVPLQPNPANDIPIQEDQLPYFVLENDVPLQPNPANDIPIQEDQLPYAYEANDVPLQPNPANDIPLQEERLPLEDIWDNIIAAAAGHDCETVLAICALNKRWKRKCDSEDEDFWNPIFEASQFIKNQPRMSNIFKWGMRSRDFYERVCWLSKTAVRRTDGQSYQDFVGNVEELVRLFSIDTSVRVLRQANQFRFDHSKQKFVEIHDTGAMSDGDTPVPHSLLDIATIRMPSWLKGIGNKAFYDAERNLDLDFTGCRQLKFIGESAFYNAKLKSLNFTGCTSLEVVEKNAFTNAKLTSLDFTECASLTDIQSYAFQYSPLQTLTLNTTLQNIGDFAFSMAMASSTSLNLTMCTKLKNIGKYAFFQSGLLTLDFTRCISLTDIQKGAFNKSPLTELVLTGCAALKSIGEEAFQDARLNSLDLTGCIKLEHIQRAAFQSSPLTELVLTGCSALKIIDEEAFQNAQLNSLDLTDCIKLEHIKSGAFQSSLTPLENLTMPRQPVKLAKDAFGFFQNRSNIPLVTPTARDDTLELSDVTLKPRLWIGEKIFDKTELYNILVERLETNATRGQSAWSLLEMLKIADRKQIGSASRFITNVKPMNRGRYDVTLRPWWVDKMSNVNNAFAYARKLANGVVKMANCPNAKIDWHAQIVHPGSPGQNPHIDDPNKRRVDGCYYTLIVPLTFDRQAGGTHFPSLDYMFASFGGALVFDGKLEHAGLGNPTSSDRIFLMAVVYTGQDPSA